MCRSNRPRDNCWRMITFPRASIPMVRVTARPPNRLFRLVLGSHDGTAMVPNSEEKHEPVSDIDTEAVDSLKVLTPTGRVEKRTKPCTLRRFAFGPNNGKAARLL